MTCEGWEGFCAVEELPGIWALYYDRDDDGLRSKVAMGTRVLEVELTRREKKEPKPVPDPNAPKTVDEKMKQHQEQTAKEEAEKVFPDIASVAAGVQDLQLGEGKTVNGQEAKKGEDAVKSVED